MTPKGSGAILLTKPPQHEGISTLGRFRDRKFALRGLAQNAATEFGPKGILVGHIVIDGRVPSTTCPDRPKRLTRPSTQSKPI